MPPKFDFAHTTQLDNVDLLTSRPSRIDFDAGDGLHLVVEAHAPGVFRLRCGEANQLNDDKPGARARAVAEMLLARQEAVGEATVAPSEGGDGWRISQGDVVLEVQSNPVRVAIYRNDFGIVRIAGGAFAWEAGRDYQLTFEAIGDRLRLLVDGVAVLEAQDAALSSGMAGCGALGASRTLFGPFEIEEI